MTEFLLQYPLASLLLKLAVGSSVVLGAALILARWNRRGTAATRCLALQAGLIGVLFLPVAFLSPGRSAEQSRNGAMAPESTLTGFDDRENTETDGRPRFSVTSEPSVVAGALTKAASTEHTSAPALTRPANVPIEETAETIHGSTAVMPLVLRCAVAVWLLVAGLRIAAICLSMLRARWLANTIKPLERGAVAHVARQFTKNVDRLQIGFADVPVPVTTGLWRHRVLVPPSASEWDSEQAWMVLAHETAHVRRFDVLARLICQLGCAVVWFNPLAWRVYRLAESEREVACDDQVLLNGGCAADYADCLLGMSQSRFGRRLAAISIAEPPLLTRVRSVLNSDKTRGNASRAGKAGTGALMAGLILACGVFHPTAPAASAQQDDTAVVKPRTDKLGDPLEKHVIHRFGTRRLQHPAGVLKLCQSNDGSTVITHGNRFVIGWDATSGKQLWQVERDRGIVYRPQLETGYGLRVMTRAAETGEIVSLRTKQNIPLWNPRTGEYKELEFPDADEDTKSIDISPNGKLIAIGGSSEVIVCTRDGKKLFGIANNPKEDIGKVPAPWRGRDRLGSPGEFSYARFTPDGKLLALVNSEKPMTFQIFDSGTGGAIREIKAAGRVVRFVVSPDSKTVAATERDCGIRLYDIESGKQVWETKLPPNPDAESYTTDIDFHPNGNEIAVGACLGPDRTVRILDARSGEETQKLKYPGWRPWALQYSPDGKTLSSSGWSGGVHRWNTSKYELLPLPGGLRTSPVCSIAGKGNLLAFQDSTGTIHIADQESGDTIRELSLPDTGWSSMQFNPDGTLLASAGTRDDKIHLVVWDVTSGKQLHNWSWDRGRDPHSEVYDISFSGDQIAAEVFRQSAAYVWDMKTGKQLTSVRHRLVFGSTLNDGKLVTAGWDMWIREWDSTTGKELRSLQVGSYGPDGVLRGSDDKRIYKVVVSTDRSLMATADMTSNIRLYDRDWNEVVTINKVRGSQQAFALSRNSLWISRASSKLNVYDIATGDIVFEATAHQNEINRIEFGPRDRTVLTGGDDGICNLWELPTPKSRVDDDKLFANLIGTNGKLAFAAFRQLDADADRAVTLLEARLKPFAETDVDKAEVRKHVVALGSGKAELVKRTRTKLFELGPGVVPILRAELASQSPSEEKKSAITKLAFEIHRRYRRASMLLAQVGSDDAAAAVQRLRQASKSKSVAAFIEEAARYQQSLK